MISFKKTLILFFLCISVLKSATITLNLGDTIFLNFTQPTMSASDLTVLMNNCAGNNVCSYAWGLLFGGQNAQDAFNALLNSNPPTPLPLKNYFGIASLNNTVVSDADKNIQLLMMVYSMLVATPHCRYDEIQTIIVPSTSVCTRDPKLPTFTISNNYTLIIVLLILLVLIALVLSYSGTKIVALFSKSTKIIEQKTILN